VVRNLNSNKSYSTAEVSLPNLAKAKEIADRLNGLIVNNEPVMLSVITERTNRENSHTKPVRVQLQKNAKF
ncbi:hypothetical protein MHBO_002875, partial [Bonamia ostreae]